uniref:THAP-type domain-containing protein n=1 Tax=Oncorhynchus mykiss TaxID=8022 RepID=A0A8C7TS57_ONCMY
MDPKMPNRCAAPNCNIYTDKSDVPFFRFPLDSERCKQWLNNCHRSDLEPKTPEELHNSFQICANHFEPSLICRDSTLRTSLKEGAIPTRFDFTSHLNNPSGHKRNKRIREPAEAELASLKKAKGDWFEDDAPSEVKDKPGENSATCDLQQEEQKREDVANSKAKEILKVYFKETLAFTGFSIGNDANPNTDEPMGDHRGQQSLNPICVEKIDQKEVLQFSEDLMREEIRNSLRLARFFSILLQDVTNIEGKDQIPVFIRSVTVAGFPQKHLMGFLPCYADAEGLFYMLLSEIRNKWGLRMEHCRGLTYLTTGGLCQKMKDLTSRILQEFPQVVLAPSDPYAFNMWLIRSMPIPYIQKVVNTVEDVAKIIRGSPDLWERLEVKIKSSYSHLKGEVDRIIEASQNTWEYGVDAFQTMLDILEPFLACINEVCSAANADTATCEQMAKLKPILKNFNFIITLVVLKNTLCCVSILNPSLRGAISISSTLQYTISNALKLVNKHLQEIAIFHRKWFSDAVGRAKKLGVEVARPDESSPETGEAVATETPLEDFYRETLSRQILQYLVAEVKRVFSTEMVRILRWLSLVPSYMADHNFSIRRDKVADANLNNLARPDTFYDELGCWEVKWRHASKRRILPTTVFATLKIPDIAFYPNVQSLLRVLGTIPCVNAEADVYGQYNMVLERYQSYLKATPEDKRLCNMAFVYVNQDVHFNVEDMVESYVEKHIDILQFLHMDDEVIEMQPDAEPVSENDGNHTLKENVQETQEEPQDIPSEMETERVGQPKLPATETNKEALKSALQVAVTAAYNSQSRQPGEASAEQDGEVEDSLKYVSKSEMEEVLRVCEDAVREGILVEVGTSFFSLFIDRVVKLGEKKHLPLFLRFVDSFDVMRLELMGFLDVDLDCDAMSERILEIVTKEWHLDLCYCRGQAYLGSGDVSYKLKAFACKIQEKYPLAICTHCSCYSFNIWWSKSTPVSSVKRALDVFEEVLMFFGSMPMLEKQLDHVIAFGLRESYEKVQELQGKFCTVWQEKHDSYEVFVQMLEPLVECLEKIKSNPQRWKSSFSLKAGALLRLIRDFDFIVPMVALKNTSSFTRELSAGLQKDHFSAASQLCQISGIVATLNRVKTNIKVFHQNWFDEACALAQSLGVQIKVPDNSSASRDSMMKPALYYKDALSVPLVDNLTNAVKDHFSEDHKEALNFLSLVPCSVTVSYMFEILRSKPPLYASDLPDSDNFFTELCCWRVKWKTKVASVTIPDTIFQTLRLPLMQYFGNINTLLRIMSVLPSTVLENCGEVMRHKMFQEYLRNTSPKDRSPCLAMLQVGTNFSRDLDRMVTKCLKVTPQALEGICLDKESKSLMKNSEANMEVDHGKDGTKDLENQSSDKKENQEMKAVDENGHTGDNRQSLEMVFRLAARLGKKKCQLSELSKEDQVLLIQDLGLCHWFGRDGKFTLNVGEEEMVELLTKSIREVILLEIQESPFFSLITDKPVVIANKSYLPVFVRYVGECAPKVELIGFLRFFETCDVDVQVKNLSATIIEDWGLPMSQCRGQAFMRMGSGCHSLKKMSLEFLESYPLSVITPSESCGLACWLAGSVHCPPVTKMLGIVEDLLLFFDQSPGLEAELAQAVDGLLNTPREALEEIPETCCSRWKKREDFFDLLVDTLEGVLSCLDSVSSSATGTMSLHAQVLATALREMDFVVTLVILKNACSPLRNCSTVFRCGNPADIICEVEKIVPIIETLNKMLENISTVHTPWFEEAFQLASKVAPQQVCFPEEANSYESPEVYYRDNFSVPVLRCLIDEMKYNFSDSHLKALKLLSLLPTCNPQPISEPIRAESTDKLYSLYLSDLPDPDTVEQDISNWATVWKDKYQDMSPPASISEILLHPESQSHPTVTMLLRLVAVLPSVSMEWDLMKTTLNSMRALLKSTVCKGSKTDTVMLLMHYPTVQRLREVIEKCIEVDPESIPCLEQVKKQMKGLKLESDFRAFDVNPDERHEQTVEEHQADMAEQPLAGELQEEDGVLMAEDGVLMAEDGVALVAEDGAALVAEDGAALVAEDGAALVAEDGAALVAEDGAALVAEDGAALVAEDGAAEDGAAEDGAALVAEDGAALVAEDGAALVAEDGAALVAEDGAAQEGAAQEGAAQAQEGVAQGQAQDGVAQGQAQDGVAQGQAQDGVAQGQAQDDVAQGQAQDGVAQGQAQDGVAQGAVAQGQAQGGGAQDGVAQGQAQYGVAQGQAQGGVAQAEDGVVMVEDRVVGQRQAMSFYDPPVREEILKELWDSQFFTIITEQAVEIEGQLYVPLCIRYLDKQDTQCEETVAFIPFSQDTAVLADAIETALSEKWGLNMAYCRGQALLSVGEVGSRMRAVSAVIAQKYPLAMQMVSSAVSLNVWLARSSPAVAAADCAVSVENMLQWLTEDAERQIKLEEVIIAIFQHDEGKGNELRDKLIKNWEKSHDMHDLMVELLEVVMLCLNELKSEENSLGSGQALLYFDKVRRFEFIFTAVVLKNVLSSTKKLSQSLQGKPLDVLLAMNSLPDLLTSLNELKSNIDTHHKAWFKEAVSLASKLQITLLHSALLEPLSQFYKMAVSQKVIEHSIAEVSEFFTEKVLSTLRCLEIVPYAMSKLENSSVNAHVLRMYKDDMPDLVSLPTEMKSWREKWLDPMSGYLPATVLDTLKASDIRSFSNIETLLRLLVILPFSRRESTFRQGKRSLQGFIQQETRSLSELHPL